MENETKPTPQKASQSSEKDTGVTRGYNPLEIEDEAGVPDSDDDVGSDLDMKSPGDTRGSSDSKAAPSRRQ